MTRTKPKARRKPKLLNGEALLRAALKHPQKWRRPQKPTNRTDEDLSELALAWALEHVTITQVNMALFGKQSGSNIYCPLARGLRAYIKRTREDIS